MNLLIKSNEIFYFNKCGENSMNTIGIEMEYRFLNAILHEQSILNVFCGIFLLIRTISRIKGIAGELLINIVVMISSCSQYEIP